MSETALVPWSPRETSIIPVAIHEPQALVSYAVQLSQREQGQIARAFEAGSFEMASVFVWTKAIAALRRRLSSLGMDLIGQMLGRPDIDEFSSIDQSVTDHELIGLATDLGVLSATQALRMKQTQELVTHFSSIAGSEAESNQMHWEEAIRCVRTSIEAILGHAQIELPHEFVEFRRSLESRSFHSDDKEIGELQASSEFFRRTTISILLAQLQTARGAMVEHAHANVRVIVPAIWSGIGQPIRWQIGQTYAELHNAGKPKALAARALRQALVEVQGFDYVPETLRSTTYSAAAQAVLQAHERFDNFQNEVPVMNKLASLGTSIPMPAFPPVMTAILSVFLGNRYGHSFGAEKSARQMLDALDKDKWIYFFREVLPSDRIILAKLSEYILCQKRWKLLVDSYEIYDYLPMAKSGIAALVHAARAGQLAAVELQAKRLYAKIGPRR